MNFGTAVQAVRIRECEQTRWRLITFEQWEQLARELLDPRSFSYAASGAGEGTTIRNNRESFGHWRILPRVLRDVANRDLSVRLFGQFFPFPIGFAPIGRQAMFHPHGEVASARAAARLGIPFIQSMVSTYSMEEVAEVGPHRWFHLFIGHDRDVIKSLVLRAERSGFSAGHPPRGVRKLEKYAFKELEELKGTIPIHSFENCYHALKNTIKMYQRLRQVSEILPRKEAERVSIEFLDGIYLEQFQ